MKENLINRREFNTVYDSCILGKTFVEDLSYYRGAKERFWKSFAKIQALGLPPHSRVLDIGGGIMAVLLSRLLKYDAIVGDLTVRAKEDVESSGLSFVHVDLFSDEQPAVTNVDLVVLQEVIEHIPQPPYIVLGRISRLLADGGFLFLTTPNGHRFRNLMYMVTGKEILDLYKYPTNGEGLGHQHEYTLRQMIWQARHAGMELLSAEYYEDGFKGATTGARIARTLTKPAALVPHWRNGLMMVARFRQDKNKNVPAH